MPFIMGLVKKVKGSNRQKRQGKRRHQDQGSEGIRVGKRKPAKAKASKQKITERERKSKLDRVRCAPFLKLNPANSDIRSTTASHLSRATTASCAQAMST